MLLDFRVGLQKKRVVVKRRQKYLEAKEKIVQKLFKVRVTLRSEIRARQFWFIEFVRANSGLYDDFLEILFFSKNFFSSKVPTIFC